MRMIINNMFFKKRIKISNQTAILKFSAKKNFIESEKEVTMIVLKYLKVSIKVLKKIKAHKKITNFHNQKVKVENP